MHALIEINPNKNSRVAYERILLLILSLIGKIKKTLTIYKSKNK